MAEYIIYGRIGADPITMRIFAYNVHDATTRFKKQHKGSQVAVISCKKVGDWYKKQY
jgi:hypothetical protein